jgi:hypothetical protein
MRVLLHSESSLITNLGLKFVEQAKHVMKSPIQIISVRPNASLAGGVGVLEAVLECFSFCQAKNLYWSSLDILCIVKVVITQCCLVMQRGVLHEAMSLECGEYDSTPVLCSTSSC